MSAAPERNAAIWYTADGFDPQAKGINGRRVAGLSFLQGFLRHAEVDEFFALTRLAEDDKAFRAHAEALRPKVPVRSLPLQASEEIARAGCLQYPGPNLARECWRRAPHGAGAWSIVGITHTTATAVVMDGFFDFRMSPQTEWDAVICTSQAVEASVRHQFSLIDEHLVRRFRARPPPMPQLPVIPLGIHTADFAPDPRAGAALRKRLGVGPDDVVFGTIARLSPHEKFDPLPVFQAFRAAQAELGPKRRLHVVFAGVFAGDHARQVFEKGAAAIMPDVGFVLLDGADAGERRALLSGSDVFLFPIDNVQETFGLAPIEAMAAGLPVLASDWDGLRDTVTDDVGLRVTTRALPSLHTAREAIRYLGTVDGYAQYASRVSSMVQIDLSAFTAAILTLSRDKALRRRLGQAGQRRAVAEYDWARIIPRMQDLWEELAERRRAATPRPVPYASDRLPLAPSPTGLFASYPTEVFAFAERRHIAVDRHGLPDVAGMIALRDHASLKRIFEGEDRIKAVLAAIVGAGPDGLTSAGAAKTTRLHRVVAERVMAWLLKHDFIRPL